MLVGAAYIGAALFAGCGPTRPFYFGEDATHKHYLNVATRIEMPAVPTSGLDSPVDSLPPRTLANHAPAEYWDLTLEEAVQLALANSDVMRELGGRVLQAPSLAPSIYDPAIQESDPRFGVQGALSRFDAQFATSMFWARNDRVVNNLLIGGGVRELQQDLATFEAEITKRAATGSQFGLRHIVEYDANNRPVNFFPSAYDAIVEAEVRHPLLRGGGIEFNRIAGPDALPGLFFSNGVLLARIDTDISLAEFEAGVRDLVSDVETAYWELYFAYRQLDARVAARDSALATWRRIQELGEAGAEGGEAEIEAQAGAEYFALVAQVQDALSGGVDRQRIPAQSAALQGTGGLYEREANLRLLIGLPGNDGQLIRPADEPTAARYTVGWEESLAEAFMRRVELRGQRWQIQRQQLELTASRNFLLPQLDVVARYRWRGFGDDLLHSRTGDEPRFDNAYQTLFDNDFQEWLAGLEFSVPIGLREGFAAVRKAELELARERAVLAEQERQVEHDLASSWRELERAHAVSQTRYNGWIKNQQRVAAVERAIDAGLMTPDALLEARREEAQAEVSFYRALVEYNLAIKTFHFEKGTLLDYSGVTLAEGPWPHKAYHDAHAKARRRAAAWHLDYTYTRPQAFSRGEVPRSSPPGEVAEPVPPPSAPEELPAPHAAARKNVVQATHVPSQAGSATAAAPRGPVVEPMYYVAPATRAVQQPVVAVAEPAVNGTGPLKASQPAPLTNAGQEAKPLQRGATSGFTSPTLRQLHTAQPVAALPAPHERSANPQAGEVLPTSHAAPTGTALPGPNAGR